MAVQTSGSVALEIGSAGDRRKIVLDGQVGNQIQVGFRAKDGDKEIKVGSFTDVVGTVAEALGAGPDFQTEFEARLTDLEAVGPLKPVVIELREAQLFVTDLALQANYDEAASTYKFQSGAFGFRVEFAQLELGPIKLVGFGVLFEYTEDATGAGAGAMRALP
ncbi:MAG: hypothetical protein ABJF50_25230 [Paracoccaceae bacterium]|uniref:hypothetical protein n=1 Tax=Hyphomonas sp. TaxID=87 RepID=UPI00328308C0